MNKMIYISDEQYAIAKANGISRNLMTYRVRKMGWNIDEAMTKSVQDRAKIVSDEIIKKAKTNDIPYRVLRWRLKHGWSLQEAISTKVLPAKECGIRGGTSFRKNDKL